ncbi:MAG: hypothetical protein HOO99_14020 [Hyphomicrobiaceae bacterium]|nr:hypothetical protein [Hyphomicrobiaceae bacterium]
MIGRFVLTFLQVGLGWVFAPELRAMVPLPKGQIDLFVLALIFAGMFWVIGIVVSLIFRSVSRPSLGTFSASIVMGLAGAALGWIQPVTGAVNGTMQMTVPLGVYPMAGALIGYMARR